MIVQHLMDYNFEVACRQAPPIRIEQMIVPFVSLECRHARRKLRGYVSVRLNVRLNIEDDNDDSSLIDEHPSILLIDSRY